MKRRDFLKTIILATTAPAFVKADNLMGLYVPKIFVPGGYVYVNSSLDIPKHLRDGKSWKTAFKTFNDSLVMHDNDSDSVMVSMNHTEVYHPRGWCVKDSPALVDIHQVTSVLRK